MVSDAYTPDCSRYDGRMKYKRAGRSGILLPEISLGLWQNFGYSVPFSHSREIVLHAFDRGVVSFDLANNYGDPYGSAESVFGKIMTEDLRPYRDELFIATKAGYDMWQGPYGNWGSRKYLISSLDQSLKRLNLDYVDVFYSHRYDPDTPLDETLQALVDVVRSGKALYVGISRWPIDATRYAISYLREAHTPCLLYQGRLNILDQECIRQGILTTAGEGGCGFAAFSTLAEGLLTSKYLEGIPAGSRADRGAHLTRRQITPEKLEIVSKLNALAQSRGETLAQMATAWVLAHPEVTTVVAGCSRMSQLDDTLRAVRSAPFSEEELGMINTIVGV